MELHAHDLKKIYDEHLVLDHLNFDLSDISSLVIIGPSGGGKTTLLRIIAGLETPTGGTLKVNNHEIVFKEDLLRDYRKNIGMVFQAYNLFPHLTAVQNITLPLTKVHNYSRDDAEDRALTLLKRFRLEEHGHKKPSQLSGGQKQRIAISRAVAANPEVLLLDEPTSALDPEFTAEVLDLIEELREDGMQLIMVTHEMGFARHVADHILFMADGDISESAPPELLFDGSPNPAVRQFLDRVLKY
jgi:polar amino acid transport system ATP-binding protein